MITTQELNKISNIFQLIGKEWMLISAGDAENFNTMTASWGAMGELWFKPVVFIFVRNTRYTFEFLEKASRFTLTFFHPEHKSKLQYCGSNSGRNVDKVKQAGLTKTLTPMGNISFKESYLTLECKKLYFSDINPSHFIEKELDEAVYPKKDYHRMYVGEIEGIYWAEGSEL